MEQKPWGHVEHLKLSLVTRVGSDEGDCVCVHMLMWRSAASSVCMGNHIIEYKPYLCREFIQCILHTLTHTHPPTCMHTRVWDFLYPLLLPFSWAINYQALNFDQLTLRWDNSRDLSFTACPNYVCAYACTVFTRTYCIADRYSHLFVHVSITCYNY